MLLAHPEPQREALAQVGQGAARVGQADPQPFAALHDPTVDQPGGRDRGVVGKADGQVEPVVVEVAVAGRREGSMVGGMAVF